MEIILIFIISFIIDLIVGDPKYFLHPIRIIGYFSNFLTNLLNKKRKKLILFILGVVIYLIIVMVFLFFYIGLNWLIKNIYVKYFIDIFLIYSMLSLKDLILHSKRVRNQLELGNIIDARKNLSMMVGRDTKTLNESKISSGVIESLAENFTDGIISPMFYCYLGIFVSLGLNLSINLGVIFIIIFKITSTLDSMIGYKNEKYIYFGKFSARMDDIFNFIPARLAIIPLSIATFILRLNLIRGLKVFLSDRKKHSSPNSGCTESFYAGTLDIKFGGVIKYKYGIFNKPILNSLGNNPCRFNIKQAENLSLLGGVLFIIPAIISFFIFSYLQLI